MNPLGPDILPWLLSKLPKAQSEERGPTCPTQAGDREKPGRRGCPWPLPGPFQGTSQDSTEGAADPELPRKGPSRVGPRRERGHWDWGGSQEKQSLPAPPTSRQERGPWCQPLPTPGSATHLPEPAVANLLQVQEAVPAQVCGLEQLHCNGAGRSGTSAQPPPPPLTWPRQGLPFRHVLGATPGGCPQEQGAGCPGELWTCKMHLGIFLGGSGKAVPQPQGRVRLGQQGLDQGRCWGNVGLQCGQAEAVGRTTLDRPVPSPLPLAGIPAPGTPKAPLLGAAWHGPAQDTVGSFSCQPAG